MSKREPRKDGRPPGQKDDRGTVVIKSILQLAAEYLSHHFKAMVAAIVLIVAGFVLVLSQLNSSDCLEIESHYLGTIRARCSSVSTPSPATLVDGLRDKYYTNKRAAFTLRVEEPDDWSIVHAEESHPSDGGGPPTRSFSFPPGVLASKEIHFLTDDGVVAFVNKTATNGGKASLWIYLIRNQAQAVQTFIGAEQQRMLRMAPVVLSLIFPPLISHTQPERTERLPSQDEGRVELTTMKTSSDHKEAILVWNSPYHGVNADIVARVVVGYRDTYYVVAARLRSNTPNAEKINYGLRTMLESFHVIGVSE